MKSTFVESELGFIKSFKILLAKASVDLAEIIIKKIVTCLLCRTLFQSVNRKKMTFRPLFRYLLTLKQFHIYFPPEKTGLATKWPEPVTTICRHFVRP